jgi:PAS domain S-box-containing protein
MNVRFRNQTPGSLALLVLLICAGFAGNFFAPPLYLGFDYLLGSVFVLLILRLFGTGWGVIAGLVASSATIFRLGHPYAMVWLCAEPLFVGWLLEKGKTRNIILFDAVYWPLVGAPLLWLFFSAVMHVAVPVTLAAMLLQWITGITNALVASLLLTHLPALARNGGEVSRRLSVNFRAMADALAGKFQEITLYNETLEARVRERTQELIRANEELQRENAERTQTEQQRDQLLDELVNQLRFLQKIIDAIPNPIFYRDMDGVYQGCNRAFEESWGLSREEIVGKTVRDLFSEETARMFRASDLDGLGGRPGAQVFESQLCYADGRNHEVIIYKSTYDDIRGNAAGVVGSIVDISLRKKAEAERDRLVVELQQKNKELEGIVYVASHDLRSPLVNIQGFSRKLSKNCTELESLLAGELGEEQRLRLERILGESIPKSLGFVIGSVEKMDVILKGLLRLSRLGRAALCFDTLDMQSIMEKIAASMAFQIDTAGARVDIERLGPCVADAGQISQVFSNLLDNAIKYRSPERPLHVRITSQEFDEGIRYCVEDNGIGIPRDQQEAIWEIFHRLDPDSSQGEGLGLTLARRIVARLGGSIWVESTEGEGSCFYVVLPKPAKET